MTKPSPAVLIISLALILSIGVMGMGYVKNGKVRGVAQSDIKTSDNTDYANAQELKIFARNGYSPSILEAKADQPTILKVETRSTFDCSAAMEVPSVGFDQILPPNGVTEIKIPPQKAGTEITGGCSMGMYGFKIIYQ